MARMQTIGKAAQPAGGALSTYRSRVSPRRSCAPTKQPHRITRHSYTLASRLRGCSTELAILDEHYLGVRSVRPDAAPLKYQFDLRYANPKPVRVRRISWTWLAVCIGLVAMGVGALASAWSAGGSWVGVGAVGGAVAMCGGLVAFCCFCAVRRNRSSSAACTVRRRSPA